MTEERTLQDRAMELALGLAEDAEVAELEARAQREPEVAAALEHARARLSELDDTATDLALPAGLWDRISARLDAAAAEADETIVLGPEFDAETHAVVPTADPAVSVPFGQRHWFLAACTGLAASLVLAVALGWAMLTRPDPSVIAVLINDMGEAVALIEGTEENYTRVTLLGPAPVPDGQVMQVWTKPQADGPPVSLGLLADNRGTALDVNGLPPPGPMQLYEITFEQDGGSPSGLPTGPIHGKGLAKIPL